MGIATNWIKPPTVIRGLDHLGTQGPCIVIYSQLFPGITNVTDRARYYSFFPWLIWSFDRRTSKEASFDTFLEHYRRADCLFTLIAERHARVSKDNPARHGPAMVGRDNLVPAVDLIDSGRSLRLSTYATRDDVPSRYFLNKLGGLGQYYAGTLTQLELLSTKTKPWLGYTETRGRQVAEAFESGVPGAEFWEAVENDEISGETLDALHAFCPCCLPTQSEEQAVLLDTFFDRQADFGEEGGQRRKSFAVVLHLAKALSDTGATELDEFTFRSAVYARSLAGVAEWDVPVSLESTVSAWSYYVRNDVFSVAVQTAFAIGLTALAAESRPAASIEDLARSISDLPSVSRALRALKVDTFGELCESLRADAPQLHQVASTDHELAWFAARVSARTDEDDRAPAFLASVVRILALLHTRDDAIRAPYGHLAIDAEQLKDSPINLASFRLRCGAWKELPLRNVVEELLAWCFEAHLHVALRKLRQNSRSTFRLIPSERGIEPRGDIPPPAKTTPRFRQAVRILRDVGALDQVQTDRDQYIVTALGDALCAAAHE